GDEPLDDVKNCLIRCSRNINPKVVGQLAIRRNVWDRTGQKATVRNPPKLRGKVALSVVFSDNPGNMGYGSLCFTRKPAEIPAGIGRGDQIDRADELSVEMEQERRGSGQG